MQYTREKSKEHINDGSKSTDNVKVSLIVPMYLCEEYVGDLLDSLCGQDFRDTEIICVVDGSPDDTLKLVKEYAVKDSRIRVFRQEHKGAGAARNLGMSMARGEYLMFPDADDEYNTDYVSKLLDAVEKAHADIGICQFVFSDFTLNTRSYYAGYSCIFQRKNHAVSPASVKHCIRAVTHIPHNKIFRKNLITENKLTFSETSSLNDGFFCNTALLCAKSIVFIGDHLFLYRQYSNPNSISSIRKNNSSDFVTVYRQMFKWAGERDLNEPVLDDLVMKWSRDFRGYARICEGDEFRDSIIRELTTGEPWISMSGRELRKKAFLYCGVAKHKVKKIKAKLEDRSLSPGEREILESLLFAEEREVRNYTKIREVLTNRYHRIDNFSDNYLTMRMAQAVRSGPSLTFQVACKKLLNLMRKRNEPK